VLLDGGFKINIITEQLRLKLGLPKLKPTPSNQRMANQTTTKLVGLIKDLKIYVHNIPYINMLIIRQNSVVDSSYFMLLGRPWLKDAKVAHDWGVTLLPYNGIIRTIIIIKHLGGEIRRPKVLLCYDYQNGITYEEKDIMFATKPKLFSIGTISLPKTIQSVETIDVEIMDTSDKTSNLELKSRV